MVFCSHRFTKASQHRCIHHLVATLGGGFLSDPQIREYVERDVLANMQGEPRDQGAKRDAATSTFERMGSQVHCSKTLGEQFLGDIRKACRDRSLIITKAGYYLLAPAITKPEDVCCVLGRFNVPVILRLTNKTNSHGGLIFRFVGEAWSCELVNGEAAQLVQEGKLKEETSTLG